MCFGGFYVCWCVWGEGSGHSASYLGDSDLYKTFVFTMCVEAGRGDALRSRGKKEKEDGEKEEG